MAVFTPLTPADVAPLLARYTLGSLTELEGIRSGIENTNYFATTTQGEYVLTVFERLGFDELPFYLELMRHAASRGLPVPMPQTNIDGALVSEIKGKPCALVTRVPGKSIMMPNAVQCARVGTFLGQLHTQCADFSLSQPNLRGVGWWKSALPLLEPHVPNHLFQALTKEVAFQEAFTQESVFERLPRGPIHADLFRDNVLWKDAQTIGGVIDFYFAGCSVWLYDVAVSANDWCIHTDGTFDTARIQALLDAYHTARPFTPEEQLAWPAVLRGAALRFWISRLYDAYLPREAHLLNAHDPTHFERILRLRISDSNPPWVNA